MFAENNTRASAVIEEVFDSDPHFVDDVDISADFILQSRQSSDAYSVERRTRS